MKRKHLTPIRKTAEALTEGKRQHMWVHTMSTLRKFPGRPGESVPVQLYHFALHPECTRAVYRQFKRKFTRAYHQTPSPKKRKLSHFASRKGIKNVTPMFKPRETDAEVSARLRRTGT